MIVRFRPSTALIPFVAVMLLNGGLVMVTVAVKSSLLLVEAVVRSFSAGSLLPLPFSSFHTVAVREFRKPLPTTVTVLPRAPSWSLTVIFLGITALPLDATLDGLLLVATWTL